MFAFAQEDPFDPSFLDSTSHDPEVPLPPTVPDSVRAEIRRMYAYVVDLFLQAASSPSDAPLPRALFEEFFSPSTTPHQPIFLSWFERVRTSLMDADSRMASLLVSGSSLACSRLVQLSMRSGGTLHLVRWFR